MPGIVTDLAVKTPWQVASGFKNTFTITATLAAAAYSLAGRTFSLQIRKIGSETNLFNLTQGSGITNGGASGILTIVLTAAQSATLGNNNYFWQLSVAEDETRWLHGTITATTGIYDGELATNLTAAVTLTGTAVTLDISLAAALPYRGVYASLVALQAAVPTGLPGDYADVDAGIGTDIQRYIWDDDDADWILGGGASPVVQTITDGDTTHAPSGDAVFDALALKAPLASPTFAGTPVAPTAAVGTNTTQLATTAFVKTAQESEQKLGVRYTQIYPSGTVAGNNLTKTGTATTSFASNTLTYTFNNSGTFAFSNYLVQNNYSTSLEKWSRVVNFKLNALGVHTAGFALGLTPLIAGTVSQQFSVAINSATGLVTFGVHNALNTTAVATYVTAMNMAANDEAVLTVRRNKTVYTFILNNTTQSKTASWSTDPGYAFSPGSAGQHTLFNCSGDFNFTSDIVSSEETKIPRYIFVGDSKTAGFIPLTGRFADLLFQGTSITYVVYAQGSNYIRGYDSYQIAEINEMAGGQATIIIMGGSNDKALGGDSDATVRTNLNALVTALSSGAGAGNTVWVTQDTPRNSVSMATFAANVLADYPSTNIPTYDVFRTAATTNFDPAFSDDTIHPNAKGHRVIANLIIKSLGLSGFRTVSPYPAAFPGVYNNGDYDVYVKQTAAFTFKSTGFTAGANMSWNNTTNILSVGGGTSSGWTFNVTKSATTAVAAEVRNDSTNANARAQFRLQNSAQTAIFGLISSGYSPSAPFTAHQTFIHAPLELILYTASANAIILAPNSTEMLRLSSASLLTFANAVNIAFNTTIGTKIGTAITQKIGFWNVTPVVQQTLATGAGATADNIITMLQTIGLCKQS